MTAQLEASPRTIRYGTRARVGMLLPSSNIVAEAQISAMLPPGISLHTTRLALESGNQLSMLDRVEEGAQLVTDAQVDRIAFHCTAVSMYSPEIVGTIRSRIAAITPTPVVITSECILAAFRRFGVTKVVLLTPYVQSTNDREIVFLRHHGIEVLRERGLGKRGAVEMAGVTPDEWYEYALELQHPDADAYFLSCTAIRSVETIDRLEATLGKPVVTSNQALVAGLLRDLDYDDTVEGYGRLLRER